MRTFESAAPVLSAWMARKELTAAELSRRTGIDAGILRKIMTGRAPGGEHQKSDGARALFRLQHAGADRRVFGENGVKTEQNKRADAAMRPLLVRSHNVHGVRPRVNIAF